MERRQLEYFVSIVEHASFTRAAARLSVAQPSLSRAMKSLEHELGVELFRRTGRDIVPTDVARDLALRARIILRDLDALSAAAHARSGAVGRVVIATTPSSSIEPMTTVVDLLRQKHPGLTSVALPRQNAAEVIAAVDGGACEIGLCGQLTKPFARNISAMQIGEGEVILMTPPGSPLASLRSVSPRTLRGQRFVVDAPRTTLRTVFDQIAAEIQEYTIAAEVGHRDAIITMVLRGIGIGLQFRGSNKMAEELGAGVISLDPIVPIPEWVVVRSHLSPGSKAFLDALMTSYASDAAHLSRLPQMLAHESLAVVQRARRV